MIRGLLLTTVAAVSFGQQSQEAEIDIYSTALIEATNKMEQEWGSGNVPVSRGGSNYEHIVIDKDRSVKRDYAAFAGPRRFEQLTTRELLQRRKRLGKDFWVIQVTPATVDGSRVKVFISRDQVTIVRGRLMFGFSDWAIVYFRVDPSSGKFRLDEVELGGI